jgi:hypothetical protein
MEAGISGRPAGIVLDFGANGAGRFAIREVVRQSM